MSPTITYDAIRQIVDVKKTFFMQPSDFGRIYFFQTISPDNLVGNPSPQLCVGIKFVGVFFYSPVGFRVVAIYKIGIARDMILCLQFITILKDIY